MELLKECTQIINIFTLGFVIVGYTILIISLYESYVPIKKSTSSYAKEQLKDIKTGMLILTTIAILISSSTILSLWYISIT
jgi:hypothetical protein